MYLRPIQPTVTSDSGEDDSDEVIVDDHNHDFFLPSSLSSFGLSAISDDQDNSLNRYHERRRPLVNAPAQKPQAFRQDSLPSNLPIPVDQNRRILPAAPALNGYGQRKYLTGACSPDFGSLDRQSPSDNSGWTWDAFNPDSFPPPPPPLNIVETSAHEFPYLACDTSQDLHGGWNPLLQQGDRTFHQDYQLQDPTRGFKSEEHDRQHLSNQKTCQEHQLPQQQQQQNPGPLADRTPFDVSKLSPWQRRKPRSQPDGSSQSTSPTSTNPFSALGLRWHKDFSYTKDKENKKSSLERESSPKVKKLLRQGSSSKTIGKPDIVRSVGEQSSSWRPSPEESSSTSFHAQSVPMLPTTNPSWQDSQRQGHGLQTVQGQGYRPVATSPPPLDPSSPEIMFAVDQGPVPFLKRRSTSSDESHSKRGPSSGSGSRVKRKTKKKQKKKTGSVDERNAPKFQGSPNPSRHYRHQSLPYPQHQYFHPSPQASPVPSFRRQDNFPDKREQLLFDNPDALPCQDDGKDTSNPNMMSFRRYSYTEQTPPTNANRSRDHLQTLSPHHEYPLENARPNNANLNYPNPRVAGFEASQSNISPDHTDLSAYNFNSRANQVTKRESLPKNFQDLDISIRDEFEQIRKEYQKRGDPGASGINNNNVNKSKHSPKTSKKNSGYQSSTSSSNGEGSVLKGEQASFRPSPCPTPGFLAFQNQHAQPGKVSNTARSAPEVFKEYSLDLDNNSPGKLDDDVLVANGKRCRKHVIFLLLVMLVVITAAAVAALVLTLGLDFTKEIIASKSNPGYAVVTGNLTLKILNRNFSSDLLLPESQSYQDLAEAYSRQLDMLFLRSNLSQAYSESSIVGFSEGSIITTSSITFLDIGLIESPTDVENVINLAASSGDGVLRLGEFVVCRACAEAKLDFLTTSHKPQVLIHTIAYPSNTENSVVDAVTEKGQEDQNTVNENGYTATTIAINGFIATTKETSLPTPTTEAFTIATVGRSKSSPQTAAPVSSPPITMLPTTTSKTATLTSTAPATTRALETTLSETLEKTTTREMTTNTVVDTATTGKRATALPASTTTTKTQALSTTTEEESATATSLPTKSTDTTVSQHATGLATSSETPTTSDESTTVGDPTTTNKLSISEESTLKIPSKSTGAADTSEDHMKSATDVPERAPNTPNVGRVTLTPTVITVRDVSAALTDDDVTVTCEISNPHDWTSVVMSHTTHSQSDSGTHLPKTLVTLDPIGEHVTATTFSDRVLPTFDVTATRIRLSATISALTCSDHGVIECALDARTLPRSSSLGRLSLTSPPSQPLLRAPLDVVENREVTPAITCSTHDIGYPPWTLSLQAVLSSQSKPIMVPTEEQRFSNGKSCSHGAVLTLKGYLPVLTANGTKLVCELLSPKPISLDKGVVRSSAEHVQPSSPDTPSGDLQPHSTGPKKSRDREALSDEQMLMVIRETICHNRGRRPVLIRHPYVCTRYIACEDQEPTMMSCPPDQCFDPDSGNCGVQAAFLEPIHGALNEGLAGLACSVIHVQDWTRMRIRRHSWGAFYDDVVEVNAEGQITWHDDSMRERAVTDFRSSSSPQLAELYLWIYELECSDEDSYKCEVDREEEDSLSGGHLLKVYARPSSPALVVPTRAIEGHVRGSLQVTCEANLGRPRGFLILKRKLQSEADFRPVTFTTTTMQDEGACLVRQKGIFTISATELSIYNNSKWVCQVEPSPGALEHLRHITSSDEQVLFVLPEDICEDRPHYFLAHPVYGCEHFLHCGEQHTSVRRCQPGKCFNALTHWCDLPAPGASGECGESSGYLPHRHLCNKFISCHGGSESVKPCPPGTVYAGDGQCTTDIHESHCSKYIYGARSRT